MASGQNKSSIRHYLDRWASYLDQGRAVSFIAFSVITPPSIFFAFLTYTNQTKNPYWFEVVSIVLSHFGLYFGMLIGKRYFLGARENPSALRILSLYLFAAEFSAVILIALLQLPFHAIGTGISGWVVLVFGAMVSIAWLTISHIAVSLWLQNFRMIRALKTKTLQLEKVRSNAQGELSAQLRQLREVVSEKIDFVLEGIQNQVRQLGPNSAPRDFLASAERIRELSNQEVRELSHQIAVSDFSEVGLQAVHPSWAQTWREALRTSGDTQLYWPWVAGIGSINAIALAMQRNGLPELLAFSFGLAIGIVALRLADLIRVPLVKNASDLVKTLSVLGVYLITSVSVTWLVQLGAGLFPTILEFASTMRIAVPVAIFFIWMMVFLIRGFVQNSRVRAEELTHQSHLLELEIDRSRVATRSAREKLSKVLHGTVQGRLASVSLALTASAEVSDANEAKRLLVKAKEQLDLTREDLNTALWNFHDDEDVNAQLSDLIESWRSILEIDFTISRTAAEFLNRRQDIGAHVLSAHREAITNAARHSKAKKISIDVEVSPQSDPQTVTLYAKNRFESANNENLPGIGISSLQNYASEVKFAIEQGEAHLKVVWLVSDFSN